MNDIPSRIDSHGEALPLAQEQEIDDICSAFEQQWRAGGHPSVETYLEQAPPTLRPFLLKDLIASEIELRQDAGEDANIEEYYQRFPDQPEVVEAGWALITERGGGQDRPGDAVDVPHDANEGMGNEQHNVEKHERQPLPAQIGRYQIRSQLGEGGFGKVYLAYDAQLERFVAIKVPGRKNLSSPASVVAFLQEARAAARLKHPGLVVVHDVQQDHDEVYIVQEYIDGQDLSQWARVNKPSPERITALIVEVAEAVGFAHQNGLVHRDLKPANLLVDQQNHAHVADFGLALNENVQHLRKGEVCGTPAYMSPEQVRGLSHLLDGRSDLWSIGVIFYELLTGRRPFCGAHYGEIYEEIKRRDPRPPRMIKPEIPSELERICLKCLAKQQTDRYTSAAQLLDDLETWSTTPASPRYRPKKETPDKLDWKNSEHRAILQLTADKMIGVGHMAIPRELFSRDEQARLAQLVSVGWLRATDSVIGLPDPGLAEQLFADWIERHPKYQTAQHILTRINRFPLFLYGVSHWLIRTVEGGDWDCVKSLAECPDGTVEGLFLDLFTKLPQQQDKNSHCVKAITTAAEHGHSSARRGMLMAAKRLFRSRQTRQALNILEALADTQQQQQTDVAALSFYARVANERGSALLTLARVEAAEPAFRHADAQARKARDGFMVGIASNNIARCLLGSGKPDDVGKQHELLAILYENVRRFSKLNERSQLAVTYNHLATALSAGSPREARAFFLADIEICRALRQDLQLADALDRFGNFLGDKEQWEEAETILKEELELCDQASDLHRQSRALANLGRCFIGRWKESDNDQLLAHAIDVLENSRQVFLCLQEPDPRLFAPCLENLGRALYLYGRAELGIQRLIESSEQYRKYDDGKPFAGEILKLLNTL